MNILLNIIIVLLIIVSQINGLALLKVRLAFSIFNTIFFSIFLKDQPVRKHKPYENRKFSLIEIYNWSEWRTQIISINIRSHFISTIFEDEEFNNKIDYFILAELFEGVTLFPLSSSSMAVSLFFFIKFNRFFQK